MITMMLNRSVQVLTAALLVMLATAHTVQAQDDSLIVAGVRIGAMSLGMTDSQLYRLLGDPDSTFISERVIKYTYGKLLLTVYVDKTSHKVVQLWSSDSRYSTAEGIKVGSSGLAVAAKLGVPPGDCQSNCTMTYVSKGLQLQTNSQGIVVRISVFFPGAQYTSSG